MQVLFSLIGMGVDANVITSTRIKEEINSDKTLDGAIQKGFANSFGLFLTEISPR